MPGVIGFPDNRQEAQEFCARWIALIITTLMMLFFWSVVYANQTNGNSVAEFPRSQMLTIFQHGPWLGAFLGVLPNIAAAAIALVYRSRKVDLTFYLAVFVIFSTLLAMVALIFQILDNDGEIIGTYFESADLKTLETQIASAAARPPEGDGFYEMMFNSFRDRARDTVAAMMLWYVALFAGLLGMKKLVRGKASEPARASRRKPANVS